MIKMFNVLTLWRLHLGKFRETSSLEKFHMPDGIKHIFIYMMHWVF